MFSKSLNDILIFRRRVLTSGPAKLYSQVDLTLDAVYILIKRMSGIYGFNDPGIDGKRSQSEWDEKPEDKSCVKRHLWKIIPFLLLPCILVFILYIAIFGKYKEVSEVKL